MRKEDFMFDNIGDTIKTIAKYLMVIGIIGCVIIGIIMMYEGEYGMGLFLLIGGPISSFVSATIFYGFGQLIENTDIIVADVKQKRNKRNAENRDIKIISQNDPTIGQASVWTECPDCHQPITIKEGELVVTCPSCNGTFKVKGAQEEPANKIIRKTCPNCGNMAYYEEGQTEATCRWCGKSFVV